MNNKKLIQLDLDIDFHRSYSQEEILENERELFNKVLYKFLKTYTKQSIRENEFIINMFCNQYTKMFPNESTNHIVSAFVELLK